MAGLQLTGLDLTKQENMLLFVCPKTTESALYNTVVLAHWGWGWGWGWGEDTCKQQFANSNQRVTYQPNKWGSRKKSCYGLINKIPKQ